jgi:hypothetical protein
MRREAPRAHWQIQHDATVELLEGHGGLAVVRLGAPSQWPVLYVVDQWFEQERYRLVAMAMTTDTLSETCQYRFEIAEVDGAPIQPRKALVIAGSLAELLAQVKRLEAKTLPPPPNEADVTLPR